jgi:uncharacterized protein
MHFKKLPVTNTTAYLSLYPFNSSSDPTITTNIINRPILTPVSMNSIKQTHLLTVMTPAACSLLLSIILLVSGCGSDEQPSPPDTGRVLDYTGTVTFLNADKEEITTIDVAVADTPEQRSLGLMDVRNMPAGKGMLFIFDREEPLSFWMANTPLPLDLIFVNRNKQIVRIHHNAQPYSERQFPSGAPAMYVVEVNAGFCIDNDITEGHHILF